MGDRVAFAAGRGNAGRILVRSLDRLDMEEVPDSDGGMMPFFSHDGASVGFFAEGGTGVLRTYAFEDATLSEAVSATSAYSPGATWVPDV